MLCSVVRTHYLGQKRRDNDPAPAVTGTVRMYSITREDMRSQVRVMTMDGLPSSARPRRVRYPTC